MNGGFTQTIIIDKHTVEFSKIRRAPEGPSREGTRGQPEKTYRSAAMGVKSDPARLAALVGPPRGGRSGQRGGTLATDRRGPKPGSPHRLSLPHAVAHEHRCERDG